MNDVVREIMIDASPEVIWGFLTERDKHLQWEGTDAEIDARPGGVCRVLVAGQFQSAGEFVELVPHERVVYTFGWEGEDAPVPAGSTTVEITLTPEGDKTRLRLTHRDLPDEETAAMHTHGWDHYLGRLAVAAAGGDAGPDTSPGGDG